MSLEYDITRSEKDGLICSSNRNEIDYKKALFLLNNTHWAANLSLAVLLQSAKNSMCFSVSDLGNLISFSRVITDLSTFGYLSDFVVDSTYRDKGVGQWMIQQILLHPQLKGLRRISLLTKNASAFYEKAGFRIGAGDKTYMEYIN